MPLMAGAGDRQGLRVDMVDCPNEHCAARMVMVIAMRGWFMLAPPAIDFSTCRCVDVLYAERPLCGSLTERLIWPRQSLEQLAMAAPGFARCAGVGFACWVQRQRGVLACGDSRRHITCVLDAARATIVLVRINKSVSKSRLTGDRAIPSGPFLAVGWLCRSGKRVGNPLIFWSFLTARSGMPENYAGETYANLTGCFLANATVIPMNSMRYASVYACLSGFGKRQELRKGKGAVRG